MTADDILEDPTFEKEVARLDQNMLVVVEMAANVLEIDDEGGLEMFVSVLIVVRSALLKCPVSDFVVSNMAEQVDKAAAELVRESDDVVSSIGIEVSPTHL
jgi:hypothetical protein